MFEVVKRDGQVTEFNLGKINDAIAKAFDATQMSYNDDIIGLLSLRVSAHFQDKIKDGKVSVEAIQDSVETVLEQTGYTEVAKAYILYRKQREKMRNMKSTILDYKDVINMLCKGGRLACKGKFYRYLFCRRSDLKQFRRSDGKLLAFRDL